MWYGLGCSGREVGPPAFLRVENGQGKGCDVTEAQQAVLKKWAQTVDHREQIEDFVDWVVREKDAKVRLSDGDTMTNLLDEFYGINRNDLESALRAILTEMRE